MSRRSRSEVSVTLFPFLAVLICTMGSLIVLLVVVVQQAGKQIPEAETATVPVETELPADVEKQKMLSQLKEDLGWQAEMLANSREETLRRLKEQQTELSRAEDQARLIKEELDQLFAQAQNLDQVHQQQSLSAEQVEAEQAALQAKIDDAAKRLAAAQDATERKKRQFALIPYEGPNGTQRRPIYIECFNDRILLQPEGVVLKSDDFVPPVEPDNALASAVRAVREYYVNHGIVRSSTEPYPLIVVRPDGANAFAACRTALQGWDDEFGYELLANDMHLAYPSVDPALKELLERTIAEARWRKQQNLVPQSPQTLLSVNSRTGGFVRNGGDGRLFAGTGDRAGHGSHGHAGNGGYGVQPGQDAQGQQDGNGGQGGNGGPNGLAGAAQAGTTAGGTAIGNGGDFEPSAGALDGPNSDAFASGANPNQNGEQPGTDSAAGGEFGSSAHSNPGGLESEGAETVGGSNEQSGTSGGGGTPGTGGSFDALVRGGSESSQNGNAGSANGSSASGGASSAACASGACGASAMQSIARTQGANWALPGGADGAIAIQRPVNVRCGLEAIELLPEPGTTQTRMAISCAGGTESAVREMVTALWARIEGWGTAGTGAFWKPVVELAVAPDAEARYAEVAALLENSGIILKRR